MSRQMVRITTLARRLEILEKTADTLLQSKIVVYKTQEEVDAFKEGFKMALDLLRKEYIE